jgi:protein TonB
MSWNITRVGIFALSFLLAYSALGQRPAPPANTPTVRSILTSPRLIRQIQPEYPSIARQRHILGLVIVEIHISATGHVTSTRVIGGHPLLVQAALTAVRQWIYEPFIFDGVPIEISSTVALSFPPPATPRR